ncbi:MAG: hypothetical protein NC254_10105 [bacterium]|nr:hypothetical protein [bacterium]
MKKKIMTAVLTAAMAMSLSMPASAASSTTASNSGNAGVKVEQAAPGAVVNADTVEVAIVRGNGTVSAVSLTTYVEMTQTSVAFMVAAQSATGSNAGATVSALMTTPATPMFQATINALGGNAGINNCGTVKTLASARDAFGNTIASAGKITGVTNESLVMLTGVSADGTVEFVEGVCDPVTGQILGAFQGPPVTISVLVFIPTN